MKKIVIGFLLFLGILHGSVNAAVFTWNVPKKNVLRKVSVDADLNQSNKPFLLSDEVVQYVEDIISILRENSINRKEVDWNKLRFQFYSKVSGCSFPAQTHPKIQGILNLLGDNHSHFYGPIRSRTFNSDENLDLSKIKGEILPDHIGYLAVPETCCVSGKYAEKLQSTIKEVDQGNPEKWIIDLRGNMGGNMWQMLLGLAPLLDEGVQGYFGDDTPDMATWLHSNGEVKCKTIEGERLLALENPYNLKAKPTQVAVLIDSKTASSGEAIAVAFKGRKGTRFFGEKTFGASSGNRKHELKDGSSIYLTECYFYDRNTNKYTEGVFPDEEIINGDTKHDECLEKAIAWLN